MVKFLGRVPKFLVRVPRNLGTACYLGLENTSMSAHDRRPMVPDSGVVVDLTLDDSDTETTRTSLPVDVSSDDDILIIE